MFEEASLDMTNSAFNNSRYAGDEKLMVMFRVLPMEDSEKSAQEGRPIFRDVDHIRIMVPGNKDSIVERPITDMDIARFRARYDAWKAGQSELITGTTLEAAREDPSNDRLRITISQVEEMKYFNIKTVEQLASVSDANSQKFMGIQMLKKQAKDYLAKAKDMAGEVFAKAQLAERDNEIAALKEAIRDQGEMIKELQGAKRPGRPPKASTG